jgi:hypothetical protein
MNNTVFYREATRIRRQAKWLAKDYLDLTGDLPGYRQIMRLRRRFIWYCGFWNTLPLKVISDILKRIYAPAITDLFSQQTQLKELFDKRITVRHIGMLL